MEFLDPILHGFGLALAPENLLWAFIGCLLGTLIGVLPGVGPLATISMLLSLTMSLSPLSALIMLSGIFYGAQYGGSTTAILCNLPGEPTSVVTAVDGFRMAQKGRAGAALATAALGSLFAGIVATALIGFFAPPLASFALGFNAPENFLLMLLGLLAAIVFSGGSLLKAAAMGLIGVLLSFVGADVETGAARYTFGIYGLIEGFNIVPIVMGLFGLADIVVTLSNRSQRQAVIAKVEGLWLTGAEFRRAYPASMRGTALGSLLGLLPGGGMLVAPFVSYTLERRLSRHPEEFGRGAIEGVAGPESANNAAAQTSFIPLLTLGIPSNPIIAVMLGAMIMQGIQPGPQVISSHPDLFWGLIASMIIGNFMLVIINLPLIGIWVQFLRVPYRIMFPIIVVFCCIGAYSMGNNRIDLMVLSGFALVGTLCLYLGLPAVPLLLGFILGPLIEENFRRAMVIANGNFLSFFERSISVGLMISILFVIAVAIFSRNGSETRQLLED